jgi:hypothetical protein
MGDAQSVLVLTREFNEAAQPSHARFVEYVSMQNRVQKPFLLRK